MNNILLNFDNAIEPTVAQYVIDKDAKFSVNVFKTNLRRYLKGERNVPESRKNPINGLLNVIETPDEWLDRLHEITETRDGKALETTLTNAIIDAGAVIAGGGVLSAFVGFFVKDIDIYCNIGRAEALMNRLKSIGFSIIQAHLSPAYDQSFFRKNNILARFHWRYKNDPVFISIDVMVIPDTVNVETVVQNFDLTFCEIWYNGTEIKSSHPIDILTRHGRLRDEYAETYSVYNNKFIRKRIEKYRDRGFIIDAPEVIENPREPEKIVANEEEWVVKKIYNFILNGTVYTRLLNPVDDPRYCYITISKWKLFCRFPLYPFTMEKLKEVLASIIQQQLFRYYKPEVLLQPQSLIEDIIATKLKITEWTDLSNQYEDVARDKEQKIINMQAALDNAENPRRAQIENDILLLNSIILQCREIINRVRLYKQYFINVTGFNEEELSIYYNNYIEDIDQFNARRMQQRILRVDQWLARDLGAGDPDAPYQIPMPQEFVTMTQWRPNVTAEQQEEMNIELRRSPKPHVIYACPAGHIHSANNCGIPVVISECGIEGCIRLVGGLEHFIAPGSYIVYNAGENTGYIWYGSFPVYSYSIYLRLIEQANIARAQIDMDLIIPVEPRLELLTARPYTQSDVLLANVNRQCPVCEDPLLRDGQPRPRPAPNASAYIIQEYERNPNYSTTYLLPDCGHLICKDCVRASRGGTLDPDANATEENLVARICGICERRFKFTESGKSSCTIV